ncbi:MAG: transporter [Pasteurellaceae bacterium]|nr:transporter [Pasteurellaceae bacterium]
MSDIAVTISLLSLVAVIGLGFGSLKIKGVGLSIGGVLFGGILVSHFNHKFGLTLDAHTLHFIQEFGLILFVYSIGIKVGPTFFSSLKRSGLKLNGLAVLIVLLNIILVIILHKTSNVPLDILLGIYSGAVTNTPSLSAGQQILAELGMQGVNESMGMSYAVAYPFGICGILLTMWLVRIFFKIKIKQEAAKFELEIGEQMQQTPTTLTIKVTNGHLHQVQLQHVPGIKSQKMQCLQFIRNGVSLEPNLEQHIRVDDMLKLQGPSDLMDRAVGMLDNVQTKLQQVHMLPIFLGIGLGVLMGSIPFSIPGMPADLKLGLAGGPLVVALLLARIGNIGKLNWFMPQSANLALRELGIVLFLSAVGLKSGAHFIETLTQGAGLTWMSYGAIITFVPLMTVGLIARAYYKMNYLSLCGLLAGSMTDPPALAFANAICQDSGAAALSYATVYPLVMFLRIISPQLLAILLWAGM